MMEVGQPRGVAAVAFTERGRDLFNLEFVLLGQGWASCQRNWDVV